MIPLLLILIPLITGIIAFFIKDEKQVKTWSFVVALASLVVMAFGLLTPENPDQIGRAHV